MKTATYAVIGHDVAHSQSPEIHLRFANRMKIVMQYERIQVPTGNFLETANAFFQNGGAGLNVTAPFKHEAYRFADKTSQAAEQVGAVNTLWMKSGCLQGDTTDGPGLIKALKHHHQQVLKNKMLLLLGAGGAIHSVLPYLIAEQPKCIVIANRTIEKAQALCERFSDAQCLMPVVLTPHSTAEWIDMPFDLILNGTDVDVPPLSARCIRPNTFCYDMRYQQTLTPFLAWCQAQGARFMANGWRMLYEQAKLSFELMHDIQLPPNI